MITSESIINISAALLAAQKAITHAHKGSINPHLRNKYADLESVIEAIKDPLNEAGIVFLQATTSDPAYPGHVLMTTRLQHVSGEWIQFTSAPCPLAKQDAQSYGSVCSYLRRYMLSAITGLYQADDDGEAASTKKRTKILDGPISPGEDEFGKLSADRQEVVLRKAGELTEFCANGRLDDAVSAWAHVKSSGVFAYEEQVAIWKQMDKKDRGAIKRQEQVSAMSGT